MQRSADARAAVLRRRTYAQGCANALEQLVSSFRNGKCSPARVHLSGRAARQKHSAVRVHVSGWYAVLRKS